MPEKMSSDLPARQVGPGIVLPKEDKLGPGPPGFRRQYALFSVLVLAAAIGFWKPLYQMAVFAWSSDLYSHTLLIPAISIYLAWCQRHQIKWGAPRGRALALAPLVLSGGLLFAHSLAQRSGWSPQIEDHLALMMASFLAFVFAAALFSFGVDVIRSLLFPLAFLVFAIPMPTPLLEAITAFLQHLSADAADLLLSLSGMTFFREGTTFELPGFSMEVAPQCSGIHSTLVLFIVSIVAGFLFFRSPWRRLIFTLAVIPLAILRNGLRIFTIGQLCVQIDPDIIHSYIHKQGGPIFFGFSLIPFLCLLFVLWRQEQTREIKPK